MSFADDIELKALPLRQAILEHPFVVGVGDGTLDVAKFRHYVLQDYVYLIEYSRVLAMAAARARDLDTMGWFARLLDETLNVEMDLHRSYCAGFGITSVELETTTPAPTTVSYTSYLLNVAHQGSFPELVLPLYPASGDTGKLANTSPAKANPWTLPSIVNGSKCTRPRNLPSWPKLSETW